MQHLYLMRHGKAVPSDQWKGAEAERPLTEEARQDLRHIAAALKALDVRFDLVATSPYARAAETAEIIALVLRHEDRIEKSERFVPGATMEGVLSFIGRFKDRDHVLLVGHAPDVGSIALDLVDWRSDREFHFPAGSLCRIDLVGAPPEPYGRLAWFLPAAMMAAIGERASPNR